MAPPPGAIALQEAFPLHGRAGDAVAALACCREEGGRFTYPSAGFLRWANLDPDQPPLPLLIQARHAVEARVLDAVGDLYMTVNGMAGASRRYQNTRRLNAVWSDLDCHKLGITPEQARAAIDQLVRDGSLPPYSLLVWSGRGLWVLWLLGDPLTSEPPRATPENVAAHKAIERGLVARLAHLGADPASTNVARLMRVPGSVNTKADARVRYEYAANGDLKLMPLYTLEGFAREAGIDLEEAAAPHRHPAKKLQGPKTAKERALSVWEKKPKPKAKPRGTGRPFDSKRAKAAARKRHHAPLDELRRLIRHRRVMHEGLREIAVSTFAYLAARAGWKLEETLVEARAIHTSPPLPCDRVGYLVTYEWNTGRNAAKPLRFDTVINRLAVTREECEALGLELLARAVPKRDPRFEAFVAAYLSLTANRKPPTLRALAEQLVSEGHTTRSGNPLSTNTVRDLRDRAVRGQLIPRDVRQRCAKDRQLRLVVENPPTLTPNPPEIVAPAPFTEAAFSMEHA